MLGCGLGGEVARLVVGLMVGLAPLDCKLGNCMF